jgi:uncharacterized protein (DUF952 family)
MTIILHIIARGEWETAVSHPPYAPPSLASEGFIHCSTLEQVLLPANSLYRGRADLLLLCLDEARIAADVVYEDCYESGIEFPHIYGPLNLEAVVAIVEFPCQADGSFRLPSLNDFTSRPSG